MQIPQGHGLVTPKSKANAALLLEAAQNLDVDVALVRTTSDGYTAPVEVIDEYNRLVADLPVAELVDENGERIPDDELIVTDEAADGTINPATLDGSNLGGYTPDNGETNEAGEQDGPDAADQNASSSVDAGTTPAASGDSTEEQALIEGAEQAGAGSQGTDDDNAGDSADGQDAADADDADPLPDAKSNTHEEIDAYAERHGVTYDGIEASNPAKPTRAEKVAHIVKALENKGD